LSRRCAHCICITSMVETTEGFTSCTQLMCAQAQQRRHLTEPCYPCQQ
jgi:hypothetical protein